RRCSTAAEHRYKERGFSVARLSTALRTLWSKKNGIKKQPTRFDLQRLGDDLRETKGSDVLVAMALDELKKGRKGKNSTVVFDGIRNVGEIQRLRNDYGYDFTLLGILSTNEARW